MTKESVDSCHLKYPTRVCLFSYLLLELFYESLSLLFHKCNTSIRSVHFILNNHI